MKKVWLCLLTCWMALTCAVACTSREVQPFSVQAGEAAFCAAVSPSMPVAEAERRTLPAGLRFAADWGEMGLLVIMPDPEDAAVLYYGVWRDGAMVLPCEYESIRRYGQYYLTRLSTKEDIYTDVRGRDGEVIVGTTDVGAYMQALGDYFMLYTDTQAQLFDAAGNACFAEGVLTASDTAAICGEYLLTANTSAGHYAVWQLYTSERGTTAFLRRRFYDAALRYQVCYVGGRFLVTAIGEATADSYTYAEVQDGVVHHLRQQAWWYDAKADALTPCAPGYVLLAVKNASTPGLTADEWAAMRLAEGYSVAVVAELNAYKVHESDRYYVMDGDARLTVRYPVGITPSAILYRDGYGFVGSAAADGAVMLYDAAGNLLWQDKSYRYATMSWQSGRLVASYMQDGHAVYGAFDADGKVAVPFEYEYMSPYFEGKCVARRDGAYYVLNGSGAAVAVAEPYGTPEVWLPYGVYLCRVGDKIGLCNLAGEIVVPATWDAIDTVGQGEDGHVYVVARAGDTRTQIILK